jgi:hypothetical protein
MHGRSDEDCLRHRVGTGPHRGRPGCFGGRGISPPSTCHSVEAVITPRLGNVSIVAVVRYTPSHGAGWSWPVTYCTPPVHNAAPANLPFFERRTGFHGWSAGTAEALLRHLIGGHRAAGSIFGPADDSSNRRTSPPRPRVSDWPMLYCWRGPFGQPNRWKARRASSTIGTGASPGMMTLSLGRRHLRPNQAVERPGGADSP